jgi:hypothetical protein
MPKKLSLPEPLILELNQDELAHIETMAKEMYACDVRRRGRDYEVVYANTRAGVILEFALARQGAVMNPATFDYKVPSSHNWDVDWNGFRAEVKNSADPTNRKFVTKWLTISEYMGQKLARNRKLYPNCVDIIIFGCYNKLSENTYDVRWRCVAPFDTIRENLRKCNPEYDNNFLIDHTGQKKLKFFYNHKGDSNAVYNENVY